MKQSVSDLEEDRKRKKSHLSHFLFFRIAWNKTPITQKPHSSFLYKHLHKNSIDYFIGSKCVIGVM